jgi:hypothetical protein
MLLYFHIHHSHACFQVPICMKVGDWLHIHKFISEVWHKFCCNVFWDVFKRGVVIKNYLLCTYSGVAGFEFLGAVHGSNLSVFLTYASLNCTIMLWLMLWVWVMNWEDLKENGCCRLHISGTSHNEYSWCILECFTLNYLDILTGVVWWV